VKVLFFANTEWYLYNFRLAFAKFLRDRGFEVVMVSPVGPYGARLVAEGFRWIGLDMDRRSIHPGRELSVLYRLSRIYAAEKPDIVHHFTIKCVVYGSLIAWRLGIRKRVNAIAGMGYVFTSTALRARVLKPFVAAMMKLLVNQAFEQMGLHTTQLIGTLLDGAARHTPEGMAFTQRGLADVGGAVADRDAPFGDYGQGPATV